MSDDLRFQVWLRAVFLPRLKEWLDDGCPSFETDGGCAVSVTFDDGLGEATRTLVDWVDDLVPYDDHDEKICWHYQTRNQFAVQAALAITLIECGDAEVIA